MNFNTRSALDSGAQENLVELPDLIYIVDADDVPVTSRIPGQKKSNGHASTHGESTKKNEKSTEEKISTWAKDISELIGNKEVMGGLATAAVISLLPGGVTVGAAKAIHSVTEYKELRAIGERRLQNYLDSHAVSISWVTAQKAVFAPGHPRLDCVYRLHPLAKLGGIEYARHYIRADNYDKILLEERESELMRLLIELGATRIVIAERRETEEKEDNSMSVEANVPELVEAKMSAARLRESKRSEVHSREFMLDGSPTSDTFEIIESDYAWLRFEPTWRVLVMARKNGRCTRASIELKTDGAYSDNSSFTAKILAGGEVGAVSGGFSSSKANRSSFLFQVEFGKTSSQTIEDSSK